MSGKKQDIGVVGLGVMGRNLVLNIADHGFSVAGYDHNASTIRLLKKERGERHIRGAENVKDFVDLLKQPRNVLVLVPAGAAVDAVIQDLRPNLTTQDLIIDGGNSHYTDTDRRAEKLEAEGIHFFGMGISGGEAGARYGPSMMPGGDQKAYARVKPILEAAAAKVDGDPCVAYLGPRSAGHYVKMVHNGIEYGIMQLIAETYDVMKRGLGMRVEDIAAVFDQWKDGSLQGYLMEITADIFRQPDGQGDGWLIDRILDAARQKGTGMWTAESAMDLQVPTMTIDTAVAMRNLSAEEKRRQALADRFAPSSYQLAGDNQEFLDHLGHALYTALILTYAQGMDLLQVASEKLHYGLNLSDVARIWRGGCIIRSALLEPIREAYKTNPRLETMIEDRYLGDEAAKGVPHLRAIARACVGAGLPCPAYLASLSYFDGIRSAWLPANLIQAQRDFFGAHTYERINKPGTFHTQWQHHEGALHED
jgi:6-phosphogluconate dehydrogenase